MDKRLRVILELVASGFSSGARGASNIFKSFITGVVGGAKSAGSALASLTQAFFFVQNAVTSLFRAGKWLFDLFIVGAGDVAKLEAKLKNITGSTADAERIIDLLNQTAADTGASFDELAAGAGLMAVAAKDASGNFDFNKFQRLMNMLQRMAALRPDVPLDRLARGLSSAVQTGNWQSLEMFLDVNLRQLVGLADAAEDVADIPKQISQGVTFIETQAGEAAKDALKDLDLLDEALTKAGATAEIIGDVAEKAGLERFREILAQIAKIVGEPLFEVLNEELSDLADWLQENPDKVEEFARDIGEFLAENLEKLFDVLEGIDWEKLSDDIVDLARAFKEGDWESIKTTFEALASAIGFIASGVEKINEAVQVAKQLQALGEQGVSVLGPESRFGELTALERASLEQAARQERGGSQQVDLNIHITSDTEMFNAQVRQMADNAVTDGLNAVTEELEEGAPQ